MNDEQDQSPKSQNPGSESQPLTPNLSRHDDRNASEIAGETIDVVGESTGRFPRPSIVEDDEHEKTGRSAFMVGAGILSSRIIGVVRQRVFAYYLGTSDAAGAFSAAFRIPNFLQNVFGEGALSASFIPVYANLLARGDKKEASRVADAVLTLLALATAVIVLVGVLTTRFFVGLFAHSFDPATRELTDSLSWCGLAGIVRLVPGSTQQSSPLLSLIYSPGSVEPGNNRYLDLVWESGRSVSSCQVCGLGFGSWQWAAIRRSTADGP